MKRRWMLCVTILLVIFLAACGGGDVRNVNFRIEESEIYTQEEIQKAADVVMDFFSREYEGCTMTDLWYDEDYSLKQADDWAEQYDAEEAIVLRTNFNVDGSGRSASLNPNDTYQDYNWILVRNGGTWELKTWGYA